MKQEDLDSVLQILSILFYIYLGIYFVITLINVLQDRRQKPDISNKNKLIARLISAVVFFVGFVFLPYLIITTIIAIFIKVWTTIVGCVVLAVITAFIAFCAGDENVEGPDSGIVNVHNSLKRYLINLKDYKDRFNLLKERHKEQTT